MAPRRVYDARKTRVLAAVSGYNTPQAVRKVTLKLNGREVESKSVEVPAGGRAAVEFLSMDVPYGRNRGEVAVDGGDALPSDDVFYFSVERAEARRALFVHSPGNSQALLYFKAAIDASGQPAFALEAATPDQLAGASLAGYAFVVLSDVSPPAAFEARLTEYVRGGGSLLVALGRTLAERSRVPVADLPMAGTSYAGREGDRFETAVWLDPSHPSILKDSRWEDVKFYRAVRVQPMGARVAARLGSQLPLLLETRVGDGRVLVFASTLDDVDNDLPIHAAWVPFVEQTARYLGRLDDSPASVPVGAFAELRESKETGAAVDVVDPRGGTRAFAGGGHQGPEHPIHHGGLLRYPPPQRTGRTGGREFRPPRVRFDACSAGDPGIVAKYSQRECNGRRDHGRNSRHPLALVVRDAGGVGAGCGRESAGKPASLRR